MRRIVASAVSVVFVLAACNADGASTPTESSPDDAAPEPSPAVSTAPAMASEGPTLETSPPPAIGADPLRLVTLGDSYTAGSGTSVPRRDSWPQQLVQAMGQDVPLRLAANLAERGKGSQDVIEEQLWQLDSLRPDLVSLLIGVNDVIAKDVSLDDYRTNVATILDLLLEQLPPSRIFVVTTPDYTLTQRGGDYGDRTEVRAAIAEANSIIGAEAAERGVTVIDISPVSDRVSVDASLVAADGLHPSAKQYAGWVELIAPRLRRVLLGGEA